MMIFYITILQQIFMFLTSKEFIQHSIRLSKRLQYTGCFAFVTCVLCVNHIKVAEGA